MLVMAENDLKCILPDQNGVRVVELAVIELSRQTVGLCEDLLKEADVAEAGEQGHRRRIEIERTQALILTMVHERVEKVNETLQICKDIGLEAPPALDLKGVRGAEEEERLQHQHEQMQMQHQQLQLQNTPDVVSMTECNDESCPVAPDGDGKPSGSVIPPSVVDVRTTVPATDPALMQFQNALAWDTARADPDPGQTVALSKYVPVDLLQVCMCARSSNPAIERSCYCFHHQRDIAH
jgi:hypothetical protein